MSEQTILEALNWRYAVKKFDSQKKIPGEQWGILMESMRLAPSSYGLQPWKFVLVENTELRLALRKVSRDQSQVTDCSHFVVFQALEKLTSKEVDDHLSRVAEVREVPVESLEAYRQGMIETLIEGPRGKTIEFWAQRQAYLPMGFAMHAAALLHIDTCPMEGLQAAEYDRILSPAPNYKTIAALAFGYRDVSDKYSHLKKVRFPLGQIFETKK